MTNDHQSQKSPLTKSSEKISVEISDEVWEEYMKRYGDLIYKISLQITGDPSLCSPEDNQADLYIAAIDSFRGFCNQPGNKSKGYTPEDCLKDPGFNQYTKTVLWHKKCNKGNKVEKTRHIHNPLSLDYEYVDKGSRRIQTLADKINLKAQEIVTEETVDNLLEELNEKGNKREVEKFRKHFRLNASM
jgi:hypothetical protein